MLKRLTMLLIAVMFAVTLTAGDAPLWLRYPAISPDGNTIAFNYKGDIYLVPAAGGQAQALTTHPAHDFKAVWAPDGKTIAFASARYGNFDIYTIPITGGVPERLTFLSVNEYPNSFSVDGKNILFSASNIDNPKNIQFPRPTLSELYSVPTKGGRTVQILSTPAVDAKYDKKQKN
ncbi:MAG: peptidase S41, partial [bacterium]|nr:peptidase S41 [bacterium]